MIKTRTIKVKSIKNEETLMRRVIAIIKKATIKTTMIVIAMITKTVILENHEICRIAHKERILTFHCWPIK